MSTWFITGCSTGLGRALAEAVLERGENAAITVAADLGEMPIRVARVECGAAGRGPAWIPTATAIMTAGTPCPRVSQPGEG
jgi:NAD(P)-dependent dehydrogenase (short-subunit alcohol dehydrogenase family)